MPSHAEATAEAAAAAAAVAASLQPFLVPLKTECVYYKPALFAEPEAAALFAELEASLQWETNSAINRLTALHGERVGGSAAAAAGGAAAAAEPEYAYKDAPSMALKEWTAPLLKVKAAVEAWYEANTGRAVSFNVCLANFYQDGQQRIGWHTDREEIGRTTPIASVSLGATRKFLLRGMKERSDAAEVR